MWPAKGVDGEHSDFRVREKNECAVVRQHVQQTLTSAQKTMKQKYYKKAVVCE